MRSMPEIHRGQHSQANFDASSRDDTVPGEHLQDTRGAATSETPRAFQTWRRAHGSTARSRRCLLPRPRAPEGLKDRRHRRRRAPEGLKVVCCREDGTYRSNGPPQIVRLWGIHFFAA